MKVWWVLGGIGALFLLGLVAYNLRTFNQRARAEALAERGVPTEAVVTDAFESVSRYSRGIVQYRYTVRGGDGRATSYDGQGELPPGSVRDLGKGDRVPIRYLPEEPDVSQIEGNPLGSIEFVITIVVDVISVVGIAVLAWMLLRERARRRRRTATPPPTGRTP